MPNNVIDVMEAMHNVGTVYGPAVGHSRLGQHHGQGAFLDLRRPVKAHVVHTLEQLGFPVQ